MLQLGLQYKLDDEYTLFFDADWEDWSEFSENQLAFEGGPLNPVCRPWTATGRTPITWGGGGAGSWE